MKRNLLARTMLLSVLASALLSFTACKSDEDKCKEGDLAACQRAIDKATNDMKSALESMKSAKTPNSALVSSKMLGRLRSVELSPKELSGYSAAELRILRNAIFASHGYIFKSDDLKEYFAQFDWYNPTYKDVTARLSPIEKKNIATIKAMEDDDGEGFRDPRDGKTYRYVKIGKQTWMAENLNYKTKNSYCYKNKPINCEKYGRYYMWEAALKACPAGWHLPREEEFVMLLKAVGGEKQAGKKLKSRSGWLKEEGKSGNGADDFGFSALPAGMKDDAASFCNEGYSTYFWSSTEASTRHAKYMDMYNSHDRANLNNNQKDDALSVRCVKD